MALAGRGAVAIWHDIAAEGREDFYAWHGGEHMPERVAIPGFLRGRRYVAIEGALAFFNLYEAVDTGVVAGPDYKARLDSPTPWTIRAVKHFRDVHRSICRVASTSGAGDGGLMASWRYEIAEDGDRAHAAAMTDALAAIGALPGVAGVHLLLADRAASGVKNAEERARGQANRIPGAVLLVEGWGDEADFARSCKGVIGPRLAAMAGVTEGPHFGLYRLQAVANKVSGA